MSLGPYILAGRGRLCCRSRSMRLHRRPWHGLHGFPPPHAPAPAHRAPLVSRASTLSLSVPDCFLAGAGLPAPSSVRAWRGGAYLLHGTAGGAAGETADSAPSATLRRRWTVLLLRLGMKRRGIRLGTCLNPTVPSFTKPTQSLATPGLCKT
ncbi:uncharacterized protein BDZ99DRAFT_466912 [Mytilinidion resinicola]|uniref:Uncharacterized protein n=1 Tax=Mytilinidion resinicola TaxID=574789 RepID=A0A6A6Y8X3_9PEZI|nr:uncharacterized protein BDZ99DRAFT_466912 [Mytilinidion resinicola]KAF2805276.1 hypothetical protein BDZ99DRAFT_466912 [Mytilinidion resinicola]